MNYVVARARGGRASLLHRLPISFGPMTACGRNTEDWSRAYLPAPIHAIYCKQCMRGRAE